jgi:rod shape-determining protein MreD
MALVSLQREAGFAGRLVPAVTTLIFAVISVVPLHIPGFAAVMPALALMAAYHWTIYRPDSLPLGAVFFIGLLLDLLNGTSYLGTTALMLLLARTVVLGQRRHLVNRVFPVLWLGFLVLTAGAIGFEWLLVSLLQGTLLGPRPFVFQAVLTVACFPAGSYLLAWVHRAFLLGSSDAA